MAEPVPAVTVWPRPLTVALLAIFVLVDGYLWVMGSIFLFSVVPEHPSQGLPRAGNYLTAALAVMLVGGWAWRWAVAAGYIGGRPTARFGGAG